MKKYFRICIAPAIVLCALSAAHGAGIGVYGSFGGGQTFYNKLTLTGEKSIYALPIKSPNYLAGGGFIVDSNCARNELFNYRLGVGFDYLLSERKYVNTMKRINLTNTFGIGFIRTDLIRLWIGPQAGFYYLYGSNTIGRSKIPQAVCAMFMGRGPLYRVEHSMFGVSLGLSLGINFNIGQYVTLALEGGARYMVYYGIQTRNYADGFDRYVYADWCLSSGFDGYGSITVMYRIKDAYSGETGAESTK